MAGGAERLLPRVRGSCPPPLFPGGDLFVRWRIHRQEKVCQKSQIEIWAGGRAIESNFSRYDVAIRGPPRQADPEASLGATGYKWQI